MLTTVFQTTEEASIESNEEAYQAEKQQDKGVTGIALSSSGTTDLPVGCLRWKTKSLWTFCESSFYIGISIMLRFLLPFLPFRPTYTMIPASIPMEAPTR
jgi:hypothetical protein